MYVTSTSDCIANNGDTYNLLCNSIYSYFSPLLKQYVMIEATHYSANMMTFYSIYWSNQWWPAVIQFTGLTVDFVPQAAVYVTIIEDGSSKLVLFLHTLILLTVGIENYSNSREQIPILLLYPFW